MVRQGNMVKIELVGPVEVTFERISAYSPQIIQCTWPVSTGYTAFKLTALSPITAALFVRLKMIIH
jgi:hypothetical protein